jgi:hypothetical protein
METEPAQCLNESISQQQKDHFRSDAGEETIQACYDLISSGHPLSEILVALKQLGPLDKQRQSERGLQPSDPQNCDVPGEIRAAVPQWQTAQLTKPLEPQLLDHSQDVSAALVRTSGDWSHSLVALSARRSPESARVENRLGIKLPRPIGLGLFWLAPAISLTVVGLGGKLLSDAELMWKATEVTAGPRALEGSEDATAPRPKAAETSAPVSALSGVGRTAREIAPERSTAPYSAPVRDRRGQPSRSHTPMQRPFSMEWKIPSRLTDGF